MEHSTDDGNPAVIPRADRPQAPVRFACRALRMQRWRRPSASALIALALVAGASTPLANALLSPSAALRAGRRRRWGGGDGGGGDDAGGGDAGGGDAGAGRWRR